MIVMDLDFSDDKIITGDSRVMFFTPFILAFVVIFNYDKLKNYSITCQELFYRNFL
jgi:hypothetical protein